MNDAPHDEGQVLVAHSPNADGRWHALADHLIGTGDRAAQFAAAFDSADAARLVGVLHDLGKAAPEWQAYLRDAAAGKRAESCDHKHAGAFVVSDDLGLPLLGPVIAGHHGGLPAVDELGRRLRAGPDPQQQQAIGSLTDLGVELTSYGRHSIPAWIAEVPPRLSPVQRNTLRRDIELWLRMVFSSLIDADRLDTEHHVSSAKSVVRDRPQPDLLELHERFTSARAAVLASRGSDPVAAAREQIRDEAVAHASAPRGWFEMTAPTGSGKTVAALAFALEHARAHGLRRVVIAAPFISVTEQIADVYRSLLDTTDSGAVLEHHSGVVGQDTATEEAQGGAALRARLATENWDLPAVVTTTVQLLESLFTNRTTPARKLHRLARSVIILDEAQAIPWRLLEPTLEVLRTLIRRYGCSVVLATATQPPYARLGDRADVECVELVAPRWHTRFVRVRSRVLPAPLTHEEFSDLLVQESDAGKDQVLAVLNTITDARRVARGLLGIEGLAYLSTRLCGAHRRRVLAEVTRRLAECLPCVLVSTQVVEAGVDLDFAVGVRAVGPMPALVQVAGRVNRHGVRPSGELIVVDVADGKVPPDEYAIGTSITRDLLRAGADPLDPASLERYWDRFVDAAQGSLDACGIQQSRNHHNFPEVAKQYRLIVDETVGVLVRYDGFDPRAEDIPEDPGARRRLLRTWQPYVVSLRQREFDKGRASGVLEQLRGSLWKWQGDYDDTFGLSTVSSVDGVIW